MAPTVGIDERCLHHGTVGTRLWHLDTANATSAASLRRHVLERTTADGVIFQETKVMGP